MTTRLSSAWMSISLRVRPGSSAVRTKAPSVSKRSTGGVQPGASDPTSCPICSWSVRRSRSGSHRVKATARIVACFERPRPYVLRLQGYTGTRMASSIQATRLRKGMLIKVGNDLFRILDLHHLTPGNKRAHIQCRMRNIRTMTLADQKFRAEEDIERAVLDEREMQ